MKSYLNRFINTLAILLIIISFSIAFALFYIHLQTSFETKIRTQTEKLAQAMNDGYQLEQNKNFLFSERITHIAHDGEVLFDSRYTDLENHLERTEIQEAMQYNVGSAHRLSSTLETELFYYAIKLNDQTILRLSDDIDSIWAFSFEFIAVIVLLVILVMLFTFIIVKKLIQRFVDPINNIELEQPLSNQAYPELKPLLLKLDAHNQMRKEFSANVSHELKTPLQSIMGYSELILNDMADPEDLKGFNHKIYQEAQRLRNMIEDIISLAKLDEKQIVTEFAPINYKELVEQVLVKLTPQIKKNEIAIQTDLRPVSGEGIHTIIEETFNNLLSNAIKYHGLHPKIWLTLSENQTSVFFIIRDNGIGIAPEDIPRIFERFFRAEKSHNKAIEGSGLGLAIVKHSINLHNGTIEVSSEINRGTTFKVTLPKRRS